MIFCTDRSSGKSHVAPRNAEVGCFPLLENRDSCLADSRKFLAALQTWVDHHPTWDPVLFLAAARTSLSAENTRTSHEHLDRVLNDVAAAFLSPPVSPLPAIALNDFTQATRLTEGDVAGFLFSATDYGDKHRDVMPQAAGLITFRNPIEQVMKFQGARYFHLWNFLSFQGWCVVWFALGLLVCFLGRRTSQSAIRVVSYALPMMELLLLSVTILLGSLLSGYVENRRAPPNRSRLLRRIARPLANESEFRLRTVDFRVACAGSA